jgi:two-component system CheB/CheR fusion protein
VESAAGSSPAHRPREEESQPFRIVGIGASAGGLEAMTELIKNIPLNSRMAFVITQHLDPTHGSALSTLLGRVTNMSVLEARHNATIGPNCVYVIPPNKVMRVADRTLKVTSPRREKEVRRPIDHLLSSLAESEGDQAIGVILSGNGSDGTRGLLAVKAANGITFAQDLKSARFPSMPSSAIDSGCVDFVLEPANMGRELGHLGGHAPVNRLPVPGVSRREKRVTGEKRAFEGILALLRQRVGVDFTHYKQLTLDRRMRRRMSLARVDTLRAYLSYLRGHALEVQDLFNDILIHVTGFFRDSGVFPVLCRKVFPRLILARQPEDPIRIWVPGCSSGEEVYSLAIALMEFLEEKKAHCHVQIFGSDINLQALERARAGFYPPEIGADVSAARLRRFFTKTGHGYRINKAIRELCVFARQNVVVDPPFSKLDLISCRNLLIYLGVPLQRKIFPVFHYALKLGGCLLLGAAETPGAFGDFFQLMDKKCKIYSKKATLVRPAVKFEQGLPDPRFGLPVPVASTRIALADVSVAEVQRQADRLVLARFSPAGVVVNRQMEVLQFRGTTHPYLEHPHGEANLNLFRMARQGLAIDLRAAMKTAKDQRGPVRRESVRIRINGHDSLVGFEVTPFSVPPSGEEYYLITFEGLKPAAARSLGQKPRRDGPGSEPRTVRRLREELKATRESLQAIIDEQEATNEELSSANEEIMSSNEELQSTNEELETAKEELQSTNEELTTLNDELESRNAEMERVNNDLQNLMANVNIPVVMVGQDMRIRRYTAVAEKLLNLISTDVGRPFTDIKLRIELPNLERTVAQVIDALEAKEFEAKDRDGRRWSVRIRPYKTTDNKIDGAVIAFVNMQMPGNQVA